MLRGFDNGLLAALGVALVHGIAWSVVELTFGLLVVGLAGGWLIGYAVRQGVATYQERRLEQAQAGEGAPDPTASRWLPPPRGMSTMAAALGAMAWFVGSYVAFAIVQIAVGQGDLLGRLMPANFAPFMTSLLDPPTLQAAVLAAYVVVAAWSARPRVPKQAAPRR